MFWEIRQILIGIHIFLAILWVGGVLFVGWGVYPAAKAIKYTDQRKLLYTLMSRCHWLFTLAGIGVIVTGVILGTVLGPIKSWDVLWSTKYGNIWLSALIIALITLFWGVFIGYQSAMKVLTKEHLWITAEAGNPTPLNQSLFVVAVIESVEGAGFIALIALMVMW